MAERFFATLECELLRVRSTLRPMWHSLARHIQMQIGSVEESEAWAMPWPFSRKQGGGDAEIDRVMATLDQFLIADISLKRGMFEREQQTLLTPTAIFAAYYIVHTLDQRAQDAFRFLSDKSPQEREFSMVQFGEGIRHQAKGQHCLLHLSLLRDVRDQGIPVAFAVFERMHQALIASGLLTGADDAPVRASLASGILTLDERATAQALIDLQKAIIQHGTLEATRAVLLQRNGVLLNGLAEFLIEKDSDNIRDGTLPTNDPDTAVLLNDWYRDLLREARQTSVAQAWPRFQERMVALARQHGANL